MSLIINKNIRILNQSNLPILILILQPSLCVVDPHHVCPEKHNEVLVYIITPLKHAEMGQNWPGSGSVWHESGQNQASSCPFRHVFWDITQVVNNSKSTEFIEIVISHHKIKKLSFIINKNKRILKQSNLPILILILQPSLCVPAPQHLL